MLIYAWPGVKFPEDKVITDEKWPNQCNRGHRFHMQIKEDWVDLRSSGITAQDESAEDTVNVLFISSTIFGHSSFRW